MSAGPLLAGLKDAGAPAAGACDAGRALNMSSMLACSALRDSGPSFGISLSKTWVASSSSSQSMSSFVPLDGAACATTGGGGSLLRFWTIGGVLPTRVGSSRVFDGGASGTCTGLARLGSVERPGGGSGRADVDAGRIDAGGGSGGGPEDGPCDGGADVADVAWVGGAGTGAGAGTGEADVVAGAGIPMSVRFISGRAGMFPEAAAARLAAAPGGGGGAAGMRAELFLPRPSKISRSEPLFLSSDIRVS